MTIKPGAFRFNTDSMKLEIFRGSANYEGTASMAGIGTLAAGQWEEIQATSPEVQTGGTRGLFAGGNSAVDIIEYVNIASTGNAIDFGNLTKGRQESRGLSNRTRALWAGDSVPASDNTIDVVTIASTGNAQEFGDLTLARGSLGAVGNSTRAVFCGGYASPAIKSNILDFITIATTGNATDFGDSTVANIRNTGGCSSQTRGVFGGGDLVNTMEYITIAATGNAIDFGDLQATTHSMAGCSNGHGGLYI